MKNITLIAFTIVIVCCLTPCGLQAQGSGSRADEPILGRTLGLIGGAFGGVVLGWNLVDDDAIEAEKKLAVSMTLLGIGGAVGGYFVGREIDRARTSYTYRLDEIQKGQLIVEWAQAEAVRIADDIAESGARPATAPRAVQLWPGCIEVVETPGSTEF